jgi:hypothetical protein
MQSCAQEIRICKEKTACFFHWNWLHLQLPAFLLIGEVLSCQPQFRKEKLRERDVRFSTINVLADRVMVDVDNFSSRLAAIKRDLRILFDWSKDKFSIDL